MIGISYGAISQLFTAQLDPPALEAISPLSTIDSTITTLYPGGILNTGFAVSWAAAAPARRRAGRPDRRAAVGLQAHPAGRQDLQAQPGAARRGAEPDRKGARATPTTCPRWRDPLDPITFVHKIKAAVFMACQWEDEQTGGHCADLAAGLHRHQPQVVHLHQRRPHRLARPGDVQPLVRLPVAVRRPPGARDQLRPRADRRAALLRRGDGDHQRRRCRPTRSSRSRPTGPRSPPSRSCPRCGCCSTTAPAPGPTAAVAAGDPYPAFEQSFASFPIPGTVAETWYLGAGGSLATSPAATPEVDNFTWNPQGAPRDRLRVREHRRLAGCGATPPTGTGTGSRTRPAPRSRT